jgi:hypothetical protein
MNFLREQGRFPLWYTPDATGLSAGPLHSECGLVRCFGTGDIGQAGLAQGWAAPEDAHNWNDGPEAVLLLTTAVPSSPCLLVVEGAPLIVPSRQRQDITLYANGIRLGFWRLTNARNIQLRVTIEPEHVLTRDDADGPLGVLHLAFHLPDSLRLSAIQAEGDDRELGFCFRTLALLPAAHAH